MLKIVLDHRSVFLFLMLLFFLALFFPMFYKASILMQPILKLFFGGGIFKTSIKNSRKDLYLSNVYECYTFKPLCIMQTGMVQCSCARVLILCVLATGKQGKVCGADAPEMKNI
jgi:hypothetical protein